MKKAVFIAALLIPCLLLAANPKTDDDFPVGFFCVGEWGPGIPGEDPELPTRIGSGKQEGSFCVYKPAIGKPAPVTISIYRVSEAGSSGKQRYEVHHNGKADTVEVDFNGTSGWSTLGTFPFDGSGNEYLKLAKGRTAEVKFTIRSGDGKTALRTIVIPASQPARPPAPPAAAAPRIDKPVTLPPRPAPTPLPAASKLELPQHITDGMVIQRGANIPIAGRAPEKSSVQVTLNGKTASAEVREGAFQVVLPPMKEGGPYEMTIRCGSEERVIANVMLGDVWIITGQSNMAFAAGGLENSAKILADSDYPRIRYYKQGGDPTPTPPPPARWISCSPKEAAGFSAVGFLFARGIYQATRVPVGIIYAWRNGGDIRGFIRDESLAPLAPKVPFKPSAKPRGIFSETLAPMVGYPITGFLYYQGEGNANLRDGLFYRDLLPAMVKDIRQLWGEGDFPFICVQLPCWKDKYVMIREAQFLAQRAIPNSALVCSIDTGNPNLLHPGDKLPIGERAAKAALALANKVPGEYMGPLFAGTTVKGNSLIARFTHAGAGLEVHGALDGFVLCGENGEFAPAKAEIAGPDTVRIWRDDVSKPVAARYLWSGAPPHASLYNREGFPASPFRTDPDEVNRTFDNNDPSLSTRGEWKSATLKGNVGPDCLVAVDTRATEGECDWNPWAKWTLEVARSGLYSIYIRWPEGLAATASVRVEPNCGGYGYPPVTVSQATGGGQWYKVGKYRLEYGNSDSLKLVATGVGAAADAVKIVLESEN